LNERRLVLARELGCVLGFDDTYEFAARLLMPADLVVEYLHVTGGDTAAIASAFRVPEEFAVVHTGDVLM